MWWCLIILKQRHQANYLAYNQWSTEQKRRLHNAQYTFKCIFEQEKELRVREHKDYNNKIVQKPNTGLKYEMKNRNQKLETEALSGKQKHQETRNVTLGIKVPNAGAGSLMVKTLLWTSTSHITCLTSRFSSAPNSCIHIQVHIRWRIKGLGPCHTHGLDFFSSWFLPGLA